MMHDVRIQVHSHAIDARASETKSSPAGVMAGSTQQSYNKCHCEEPSDGKIPYKIFNFKRLLHSVRNDI